MPLTKSLFYIRRCAKHACRIVRHPTMHVNGDASRAGHVCSCMPVQRGMHPLVSGSIPACRSARKHGMILMHLSSEALKARSPVVEVEASLTAFVRRVQARPPTGPELTAFKEQLARLAAATIQLAVDYDENHTAQVDTKIVGGVDFWFKKNERQRVLWPATVKLSLDYFDSLQRHAVPLDERAIAALAHSAMALDIYCWLAQRLHRVPAAGQKVGMGRAP